VLAGMVGAALAIGHTAWEAAASAVFSHGRLADTWAQRWPGEILTASALARRAGA
jgi:NAD(P)H-hydrate repair Nnr-like enzyme with NAD(P)H-hydrate dehydratase domain